MSAPGATPRPRWPDGWHVNLVDETGSTNADLLAAAFRGDAADRSVLVARHQTAGRGRLDRRWDAPPGANLLVSILFVDPDESPHALTRRVGLAALVAAERSAGVHAELKWPNDVLVDDRKLAGILAQATNVDGVTAVVVGLGLNVRWAPPGCARLGDDVDPLDVLAAVLASFDELPGDIDEIYRHHLGTLGRAVRVELADGEIVGRAIAVEPDGRLVVLDGCGISHRVSTGDVVHLRAEG